MYTKNEKILAIGLYVLTGALLLFGTCLPNCSDKASIGSECQ